MAGFTSVIFVFILSTDRYLTYVSKCFLISGLQRFIFRSPDRLISSKPLYSNIVWVIILQLALQHDAITFLFTQQSNSGRSDTV
ncbi:hypothetical protein PO909_001527, partial [Leuciscus waleckii]